MVGREALNLSVGVRLAHPQLMEEKQYLSNRDKVLAPRLGKGYCICDRTYIPHYAKCPVCKRRNSRRRLKK